MDGTQRLSLNTSAGFWAYNNGVKTQNVLGQVSTQTYRGWKRRLFVESTVCSIIRKNKIEQPLYLSGRTLKSIKRRRHNINRCGALENVKIKQVGSVSKNRRTRSLILKHSNAYFLHPLCNIKGERENYLITYSVRCRRTIQSSFLDKEHV